MAGMDPEAVDGFGPGFVDCSIHQRAAQSLANRCFCKTEECQLAIRHVFEVKLQNAERGIALIESVGFSLRVPENACEFFAGHDEPGKPHQILTHLAKNGAVAVKVRWINTLQAVASWQGFCSAWWFGHHLQTGHHIGKLARRQFIKAQWQIQLAHRGLPHCRYGELRAFLGAGGPAGGYGFRLGVEADGIGSVLIQIAEA